MIGKMNCMAARVFMHGYGTPFVADAKRWAWIRCGVIIIGICIGYFLSSIMGISMPGIWKIAVLAAAWIMLLFTFWRDFHRPVDVELYFKRAMNSCTDYIPVTVENGVFYFAVPAKDQEPELIEVFARRRGRHGTRIINTDGKTCIITGAPSKVIAKFIKQYCVYQMTTFIRPQIIEIRIPVSELISSGGYPLKCACTVSGNTCSPKRDQSQPGNDINMSNSQLTIQMSKRRNFIGGQLYLPTYTAYPITHNGRRYLVDFVWIYNSRSIFRIEVRCSVYEFLENKRLFRGHRGKRLWYDEFTRIQLENQEIIDIVYLHKMDALDKFLPTIINIVFSWWDNETKEKAQNKCNLHH